MAWLVAAPWLVCMPANAADLTFTLAMDEPVVVAGTPRIAIDVGGIPRYATYAAGSETSSLTFSYAIEPGDFDPDGIAITPVIDLNGGTITDAAGNPLAPLTFTAPDTSNLKVQTYAVAFPAPITNANANAVSFVISKAPVGGSFTYTIGSDGGPGTVSGSGTISSASQTVSGVDVSGLPSGTLTLAVVVSKAGVGTGAQKTASTTPSFSGMLGTLPIGSGFSVRRLRDAYAGPLLRVRRASDNAEQDISGNTVGGGLDVAALTAFCGTGSCFVRSWYDQSNLGRHLSQTTQSRQPLIYSAGALETEGGKPALRFNASSDQYLEGNASFTQVLTSSITAVARCTDTAVDRHVLGYSGTTGPSGRLIRALAGGGGYLVANVGGSTATLPGATSQQRIIMLTSAGSGVTGSLDGVSTAGSSNAYFLQPGTAFRVGSGGPGQGGGDWTGTVSEVMLFNFTVAGSTFARAQGDYYGIYVP